MGLLNLFKKTETSPSGMELATIVRQKREDLKAEAEEAASVLLTEVEADDIYIERRRAALEEESIRIRAYNQRRMEDVADLVGEGSAEGGE